MYKLGNIGKSLSITFSLEGNSFNGFR